MVAKRPRDPDEVAYQIMLEPLAEQRSARLVKLEEPDDHSKNPHACGLGRFRRLEGRFSNCRCYETEEALGCG